jgi:hypothetical protein
VVEVRQQATRVVGDPEEPLLEEALLHHRAAGLARTADHLLVGEHGLVERAPVHGALLLVGEPLLVELQEDPLRPLVVARVSGGELVAPVHHEPGALQLPAEVVDVARDQLCRMDANLDGEVLRVDAERVVAERLEDGVPLQPLESSIDVVPREREEVAHMEPLGARVGEHHQRIERLRPTLEVGVVRAVPFPVGLPLPFDGGGIVAGRLVAGWLLRYCGLCHQVGRSALELRTGYRRRLARAEVVLLSQFSLARGAFKHARRRAMRPAAPDAGPGSFPTS